MDRILALENLKLTTIVTDPPLFDLSSYISNYKGRTVFRRLHLIASCSIALREEAARLAVLEAKKGSDLRNYNEAVALLKRVKTGTHDKLLDPAWATQQEKKNHTETARLENELKGYKNNLIRESIRMGNEDLGTHYYTIGDLNNATKAYSRMREYCTTPAHIASTAFRIIAVAIEQKNWLAVQSQVHKIRNLQMKPDDQARNQPKVFAAMGLQQMSTGDYKEAALSFLAVDAVLGDSYNEVITSNDIAVYGGLCALASMTRAELQSKVLENANFRNFLELEPHIRRAIGFFCACKYSQCLEVLEKYRADYLLDIYLQPLVGDLYKKIRTKSIVQYFEPFSEVKLDIMARMFGPPRTANGVPSNWSFMDEIISLIENNKLDARINMVTNSIRAVKHDQRTETYQNALDMMDKFKREAHQKLLRLQCTNAGIEVRAPLKKKGWEGDQGSTTFDDASADSFTTGTLNTGGRDTSGGAAFQGRGHSLRKGG